jgi:hypothetical protein
MAPHAVPGRAGWKRLSRALTSPIHSARSDHDGSPESAERQLWRARPYLAIAVGTR